MDITSHERNLLLCLGDILLVIQGLEGEKPISQTTMIDLLNSATERLNNHLNSGSSSTSFRCQVLQTIELSQKIDAAVLLDE